MFNKNLIVYLDGHHAPLLGSDIKERFFFTVGPENKNPENNFTLI